MSVREALGSVLRLASGSAGAQAIQFGAMLVLARVLEPAIFGDYAVFVGYGTILAGIGGLKLEQAVQVQTDETRARAFARSAIVVGGPVSLAFTSVLIALSWFDCLPGSRSWQIDWLLAVALHAWLGIATNAATAWHIRRGRFALVARLRWSTAAAVATLQIATSLTGLGLPGQVWSTVIGTALGLMLTHAALARLRMKRRMIPAPPAAQWARARDCLVTWRKHSWNLVLAGLCGTAAWQIPSVMLNELWGAEVAGQYSLALRLTAAPLGLLQASLSEIAYRETTIRLQAGRGLYGYMWQATLGLLILASMLALGIGLVGPWCVVTFLGQGWTTAAVLLPWLMLAFVFRTVGGTLSVFTQTGKTRLLLVWQVALLVGHIVALAAAHAKGLDLRGATINVVVVQSLLYAALAVTNLRLSRESTCT